MGHRGRTCSSIMAKASGYDVGLILQHRKDRGSSDQHSESVSPQRLHLCVHLWR